MNVSLHLFRKPKLLLKASLLSQNMLPKEVKLTNPYLVTHLFILGIKINKNGQNM